MGPSLLCRPTSAAVRRMLAETLRLSAVWKTRWLKPLLAEAVVLVGLWVRGEGEYDAEMA